MTVAVTEGFIAGSEKTEACFNLWAFVDQNTRIVQRISGKAYVLDGDDEAKLAVLKQLAPTDYLTAPWTAVPDHHVVWGPQGQSVRGAVFAADLDPGAVFGGVIDALSMLPNQLRSVDGQYEVCRFDASAAAVPLFVLTYVLEREDGRLVPQVRA